MAAWGEGSPPAGPWWRRDPRLPELGFRALLPAGEAPSAANGGAVCGASGEDYRALRYELGVAEGEQEIPVGQAAPLDFNLDQLAGVSYSKGCYVGQERNSFTHYRGVIRKRLMPVRLEPLPPTTTASSSSTAGELAGVSYSMAGPHAPPVYAAILTPKGKFLHDVFIYRHPELADSLLLEVDGAGLGAALQLLNRYKLRRAITFTDASPRYQVMAAGRSVGQLRGVVAAPPPDGGGGGGVLLGLAYLKLETALAAAEGRAQLRLGAAEGAEGGAGVGGGGWRVVPRRPGWWPAEWGREEWGRGRE
ncbi:putative transferase CAF17, mitochondrial [Tetrabaena socialis]|uniref:Putative transferase CAF17, mitochondrial n=1 Tax=Tetrabaena socialis TaxID=47790 RepID=A0A2J8AK41_9CHLO|nr:putative transferase CAF17, mitochondrial [Tetrabaena socialis]|eukprot:PNH12885.1 putative transferase CAF17, mitochondrial [Tetrabaena socialis]